MAASRSNGPGVSLSSWSVGLLYGVGYLLVSGAIGFGLLNLPASPAQSSTLPAQIIPFQQQIPDTTTQPVAPPPAPVATDGNSLDTNVNNLSNGVSAPAETPLDTSTETPDGYTQVQGLAGMSTAIPYGWQPTLANSYYEAADPNDSGRFVRYGATTAQQGDLLDHITQAEATNTSIQNGYQRLQLADVTYHGDDAVDWEFEYVKGTVTRHVYSRYWVSGDTQYFIYVSATEDSWAQTQPIFTVMADTATP